MAHRRRTITDEDIGIRAIKTRKARAAERATERIRHALGESFSSLTAEEIEELGWVLGELWAYVARDEWDELRFGRLSIRDVVRMLTLGSQLRRHARDSTGILSDVHDVVKTAGA